MSKICKTCHEELSETLFHQRTKSKDGLQMSCKKCNIKKAKEWAREHPERVTISRRNRQIKIKAEKQRLKDLETNTE
jgi:hypothetical protein